MQQLKVAALSYQPLSIMSRDWTAPLPCHFSKHNVATLERTLCVPSHNRMVLHWNCPVSNIFLDSPWITGTLKRSCIRLH